MTQMTAALNLRRQAPIEHGWRLYGDDVLSDIAGCDLPRRHGDAVQVRVQSGNPSIPQGARLLRTTRGAGTAPVIRLFETPDGIVYDVEGTARFFVEASGDRVAHRVVPGALIADIDHFLAGPVLGLAFQLRGGIALHASAVMVNGGAVAFAAPHGAGKSTLAANLGCTGFPVLTDDVLALRCEGNRWTAIRSLPRAKLWQDSLEALGRTANEFHNVVSWDEKRRVTIGEDLGVTAPERLPLGAIYLLDPRSSERDVEITPVVGGHAALMLMGNMYMPEAIRGPRAARTLDAAIAIAASVPVRRITYHRSYTVIAAIRDAVLADASAVGGARA